MTRRLAFSAALVAAAAVSCGRAPAPSPSPSPSAAVGPEAVPSVRPLPNPLPAVIARVNGHDIPLSHAVLIAERMMGDTLATQETKAAVYRAAMEQLVARELLFEEAVTRRITPDSRAVERMHDQVRAQYKTEEEWKKFLKLQGLDEQAFKTELRTRHTVEALIKAETDRVPGDVPESELKTYYDQHAAEFQLPERIKASHILIQPPPP